MFIDDGNKPGYDFNNKMIKILKDQVMELSKRLKIEQERNLCKVYKKKNFFPYF